MSDPIVRINCPTCNRKLKIPERSIEKAIVCPKCNSTFRIQDQSNTVAVEGRNDLFGPPVSDEYSKGGFGSEPFEEIEKIIDQYGNAVGVGEEELIAVEARDAQRPKTMRQLDYQMRASAASGGRLNDEVGEANQARTLKEKSLANNAVGLLILAFGLSLLPLAASAVPMVQDYLAVLLAAGVLLAFVACFMLAYSRRRESIASLILACMPLLFVGLTSFGTYYIAKNFLPDFSTANAVAGKDEGDVRPFFDPEPPLNLDGNGQADEPNVVEETKIEESDRLTMDPNSINNNPAAKFVPARRQKPVAPLVSATAPRQGASGTDEPGSNGKHSNRPSRDGQRRPSQWVPNERSQKRRPLLADQNETAKQLENSVKLKAMQERYQRLVKRTEREVDNGTLEKGYVSVGEIRRPDELRHDCELSSVAGRLTVYGTAYYSQNAIAGFDLAYRNDDDQVFDVVVPAVATGEFKESLVPPPGFRMTGLNVLLDDEGVRGLQCVCSKGSDSETGPWVGETPGSESVIQLDAVGEIHGLVIYRDGWSVVGLQLITRYSDEPAAQ